ncbi:hypothetical protein KR018_000185 [Drosophila ironensis]|nr:hypothetical protein KR018_000185 [Drosophila ironensis]
MRPIVVVSGSSHPVLAELVARGLGLGVSPVLLTKYANGETRVKLLDSVRGADVYIVQTSCEPINDMVMELLIMVQTCRYASAHKITAVLPLFPYARQDRLDPGNQPITAKLVANMLTMAGVNHVISMHLHSPQIQGFFDVPCDNVHTDDIFAAWIMKNIPNPKDLVIVAPDMGAVKNVSAIGKLLGTPVAIFHKQRLRANEVADMFLVGDVNGKPCVVVDDIVDTGGTLLNAAARLQKAGASKIYALVTHGIFSGNTVQKLSDSVFDLIVCSNSIPQSNELTANPKFRIIDIADILSKCIVSLHVKAGLVYPMNPQCERASV